jgi:hypothetical protein
MSYSHQIAAKLAVAMALGLVGIGISLVALVIFSASAALVFCHLLLTFLGRCSCPICPDHI